jgi:serine/threonine protein kinase
MRGKTQRKKYRFRRRNQRGGALRVYNYVESTLGLSEGSFIENMKSLRKITSVGRGVYGGAYLALLGSTKIIVKELHTQFKMGEVNQYLRNKTGITNESKMKLLDEILNEVTASSELSINSNTMNVVPPFICMLIDDAYIYNSSGGGKNTFRVPLLITGNNNNYVQHDTVYLLSKYIEGYTLFNLINKDEQVFTHEFVESLHTAYRSALRSIHEAGWLHCDIHSKNLYVEFDNNNNYVGVRILDFGKAVRINSGFVNPKTYRRWTERDDLGQLDLTFESLREMLNHTNTGSDSNTNNFEPNTFNANAAERYLEKFKAPAMKRARGNTGVISKYINNNNFNTRRRKQPRRMNNT